MARPVVPARGRPLLLKRSVRYTHLTGTPVSTPAGPTYDLLFLGTGASDPWPEPFGDCWPESLIPIDVQSPGGPRSQNPGDH